MIQKTTGVSRPVDTDTAILVTSDPVQTDPELIQKCVWLSTVRQFQELGDRESFQELGDRRVLTVLMQLIATDQKMSTAMEVSSRSLVIFMYVNYKQPLKKL